jgi:hypothetical protein
MGAVEEAMRDDMVIQHSAETLRKRLVLTRVWAGFVIAWAVIRTIVIWAALGDYGFNPWIYLSIDLVCATTDAITTPRMVLYFIDDRYKLAIRWALISLVAFVIPDIYIFAGTRTLPTRVIVILCSVILVMTLLAVISVVRKIRKGRAVRAVIEGVAAVHGHA